jgi:cystathionine beta-lyase
MPYDFDQHVNRYNTASIKWDEAGRFFGEKDILPMWIADMDFMSPTPVIEAIKKRAEHGIFGYTSETESYRESVVDWLRRRFNWEVREEWIYHSPGIVSALSFLIQTFTQTGDKVLIQPPVYYPFTEVIVNNGRQVIHNRMALEDKRYSMDIDDLRTKASQGPKMIILSNPHNPVGRVWTEAELLELGTICQNNKVVVVSDEIHADLLYPGYTHVPFARISEEFAQNCIVCTAASKTFNLAGLQTSNLIIANPALGKMFRTTMKKHHLLRANIFGAVATESAYRHGEEWLEQLLGYLNGNRLFLTEYVETRIPKIKVIEPEGTYMVWVDCRGLGMDTMGLEHFMRKEAKVGIDNGHLFGPGGEGFIRLNIACPRATLEAGLRRIEKAVNARQG